MKIAFELLDGIPEVQADTEDLWQLLKEIKEDFNYSSTLNYLIKKYQ